MILTYASNLVNDNRKFDHDVEILENNLNKINVYQKRIDINIELPFSVTNRSK